MKYIVYKTTNIINNKIYVGVHRTNPDIFDGYIGCGVTHKDKKKKRNIGFPAAVRKYGYENFKRETLFEYPDTEEGMIAAYKKEEEIVNIDFVKSKNTYNLVIGGKFTVYDRLKKVISQYTLDGKLIRTWDSIKEAALSIFISLETISSCLTGKLKTAGGFQWRYYSEDLVEIPPVESYKKTVYQFDLQGNLIKVWESAVEASRNSSNPNAYRKAINCTCRGLQSQAYGYYWSYKCKFEPKKNNHLAPVAKYNDDGEFLESYNSIKEAADANNIKTPSNIINAIKGYQKRCGGFRWRYFYGDTRNIKSL